MSATLEELSKRVDELEVQVKESRKLGMATTVDESTIARVRLYLKGSMENREARLRIAERISKEIGVTHSAISIEELHQRMIANGIRPEDNSASRGIIEMREE